jgi:hypothetical protein
MSIIVQSAFCSVLGLLHAHTASAVALRMEDRAVEPALTLSKKVSKIALLDSSGQEVLAEILPAGFHRLAHFPWLGKERTDSQNLEASVRLRFVNINDADPEMRAARLEKTRKHVKNVVK